MSLSNVEISRINSEFYTKLANLAGQGEISEAGTNYLKTELLESCIVNAIIPQEPITAAQCQRNIHDTSLHLIRDIEPSAIAIGVDNLGEPDGTYIKGARYLIPVIHFVTGRFQITVEDLMSYQYKITERVQEKSVPILDKMIDKYWFRLMGAALSSLPTGYQKIVKGVGSKDLWLNYEDHINLLNMLQSGVAGMEPKKLELNLLLMTQEIANTSITIPAAGDNFGKDRVLNGVPIDTFGGKKVIPTIKSDILPVGHIWAITMGQYLGHNYSVGEATFEIKSSFGLIEWQSKCSVAIGIGNAKGVALCPLPGSKSPANGSTALTCTATGTVDPDITSYYEGLRV
jgi:hypothetical protein